MGTKSLLKCFYDISKQLHPQGGYFVTLDVIGNFTMKKMIWFSNTYQGSKCSQVYQKVLQDTKTLIFLVKRLKAASKWFLDWISYMAPSNVVLGTRM